MNKYELQRLKDRAAKLKDWLDVKNNRNRNTYEVVAADYRKVVATIEAEESEKRMFNLNVQL